MLASIAPHGDWALPDVMGAPIAKVWPSVNLLANQDGVFTFELTVVDWAGNAAKRAFTKYIKWRG